MRLPITGMLRLPEQARPPVSRFFLVALAAGFLIGELPAAEVDFDREIRPLLERKCAECHTGNEPEGGFRIDRRDSLLRGGDSGEAAVTAGRAAASPLLERITSPKAGFRMPPEGPRLSAEQVSAIRRWIEQGAKWGQDVPGDDARAAAMRKHWSFQPITRPTPPPVAGELSNPIDAFLLEKLTQHQLTFAPLADPRTRLRRLWLDALGLPPPPEELEAFERDATPDAWERAVDRVLASPQFGERFARLWLDVVRFAETDGFEMNQERPNAWRYRDWVIQAFNNDLPYDRFLIEQLAGDAVHSPIATGFLVGGAFDKVKSPDIALTLMQRQDELADIVNTTGTAFLGMTLGCARCHNHKFDPVSQTDYYALQAVFAGVQHGERPIPTAADPATEDRIASLKQRIADAESSLTKLGVRAPVDPKINEEKFPAVPARFIRMTITATNNGSEPCLDELEVYEAVANAAAARNVALASAGAKPSSSGTYPGSPLHKLEHLNDGRHGNARSWISNTRNSGWVAVELREPVPIDRIVWGRDREGKYTDRLPTEYRIEVAVKEGEWSLVAASHDRLPPGTAANVSPAVVTNATDTAERLSRAAALAEDIANRKKELASLTTSAMAYSGRFQQPGPTHRLHRGDPMSPREVVPAGAIVALGTLELTADAPEQERRRQLAEWMVRPENPLTARVIVNRIWQSHFGRGIVDTPSDFGGNGAPPTHPELLDWLAGELRQAHSGTAADNGSARSPRGWSLKQIHRLILTSHAYQQANRPREEGLRVDAGGRWLWRFPPRRLDAEVIRDSMLSVAGTLRPSMEGPGFSAFEPNSNYVRVYNPREETGPAEWRRMIYMTKVRMQNDGVFGAFDCPDAGQVAPQRSRSTTPLQALNLLNSRFTLQQAEQFAARIDSDLANRPDASKPDDVGPAVDRAFLLALGRSPAPEERNDAILLVREHGLAALARALFNANEFLFLP